VEASSCELYKPRFGSQPTSEMKNETLVDQTRRHLEPDGGVVEPELMAFAAKTEKPDVAVFFVRYDLTEAFPFLVTKLSPYSER
jgi:hypothetical protein